MPNILNFKAIIEQDEDGFFIADVPAIPGCHAQGKTYEEVLKNAKEAIELCLDEAEENPFYKRKIAYTGEDGESKFLGVTEISVPYSYA